MCCLGGGQELAARRFSSPRTMAFARWTGGACVSWTAGRVLAATAAGEGPSSAAVSRGPATRALPPPPPPPPRRHHRCRRSRGSRRRGTAQSASWWAHASCVSGARRESASPPPRDSLPHSEALTLPTPRFRDFCTPTRFRAGLVMLGTPASTPALADQATATAGAAGPERGAARARRVHAACACLLPSELVPLGRNYIPQVVCISHIPPIQ